MHAEAWAFVARTLASLPPRRSVIEIGSRNVNGTVRDLFGPDCRYLGIDLIPGPGVDVVADAISYDAGHLVDTVVCCEVLEHVENVAGIISAAHRMLEPGGVLILTCATEPRAPHSGIHGGPIGPGEWYRNVSRADLAGWLSGFGAVEINDSVVGDLYVLARKGATR